MASYILLYNLGTDTKTVGFKIAKSSLTFYTSP